MTDFSYTGYKRGATSYLNNDKLVAEWNKLTRTQKAGYDYSFAKFKKERLKNAK